MESPESRVKYNYRKGTDPTTVTQHGLYMRPLTDPSLHPLTAPKPPSDAPDTSDHPVPPGTPPREEEEQSATMSGASQAMSTKCATVATSDESSHSVLKLADAQEAEKEANMATAGTVPLTTAKALSKAANALTLEMPPTADKQIPTEHLQNDAANVSAPSVPLGTPSVSEGSSAVSVGISSTPMGAPTATEGKSAGTSSVSEGNEAAPKAASKSLVGTAAVPNESWGRGRVTLLGDAAHATIPNGTSPSAVSMLSDQA